MSAVFSFEFMCIDGNWVAGCRLMSMLPPTAVSEMSMVAGPFSSCSPMLLKGVVFLPMRILVLVLVFPFFNYSVAPALSGFKLPEIVISELCKVTCGMLGV